MNTSYKKSNFAVAFFFLDKEQRGALSDVYAFCRLVDDIADEPSDNPQMMLDFWKEEINSVYNGKPSTELGRALARHAKKFNLSQDNFLKLIEGMEMDLHFKPYQNFEELQKYLYRVASVVGLMCLEICRVYGPESKEYALRLGYAVQMTNIIRDVYEDAALGRVYLPQEDLKTFGVTLEDLKQKNTAKTAPLLAHEGALAAALYDDAAKIKLPYSRKQLFAARVMGSVYHAILNKIQKQKYLFTKKVRLSTIEKTLSIFKAL
ncbi:phytoene synthase [Elusimicrobium posterum]|uniref:phytoene/squalene synthase family protein n=1 Tax=Elusimicrobium posterum TaxID=3116653 RepID=UPI003C77AA4E